MINRLKLWPFVQESNRIEGISETSEEQVDAHMRFLVLDVPTVYALEELVHYLQPGAQLRSRVGMDVRVGKHIPPRGGPMMYERLDEILANVKHIHPYDLHHEYETLHPFSDGNGRSGRALWLWQMLLKGHQPESFLHEWYYQSLQRRRT